MNSYVFEVIETVTRRALYTVEAIDIQSAEVLALTGETVDESRLNDREVLGRQIVCLASTAKLEHA